MQPPISSVKFTWAKGNASTEASTLGWAPGVWPSAFQVQSQKTGKVVTYFSTGLKRDVELEVIGHIYTAVAIQSRITVYND